MTGANASRKIAFAPGTFTTTTTALIKLIMSSQLPENNSSNDHLKFTPTKKWCGFCKIAGHTWNECYKRNEKGSGGNEKESGGKKGSGFSILIILKVLLLIFTVLLNPESQIFLFKFSLQIFFTGKKITDTWKNKWSKTSTYGTNDWDKKGNDWGSSSSSNNPPANPKATPKSGRSTFTCANCGKGHMTKNCKN